MQYKKIDKEPIKIQIQNWKYNPQFITYLYEIEKLKLYNSESNLVIYKLKIMVDKNQNHYKTFHKLNYDEMIKQILYHCWRLNFDYIEIQEYHKINKRGINER